MTFHTVTLPNGIVCLHRRVKSAVVHCAMTIDTGSRDELSTEHGIAHLVEHTLFKGTSHRRAWQVNCRLENLGGELNAFTTKEETVVHATTLRGDYTKAVELVADIVFHSTFPESEVEKEKFVIYDEINLYKDSPTERIFDDFEDMMFAGSSLGHNILGSKATIRKLDSDDIRRFTRRTHNTDRMVFSLIGNVSEKAFESIVWRHFGDIPANTRQFSRQQPADVARFDKVSSRGTHQTHCILGTRAYSCRDELRLPLMLLVNTLGGPSANSLLNVLLREKNALSYSVEANYMPFTDSGIASIYFSCDREHHDRCVELVEWQLAELRERELSPRRLAVAKKQFLGQLAIMEESNESFMLSAARSQLVYGGVDNIRDISGKVAALTGSLIRDVANEIFSETSSLTYK